MNILVFDTETVGLNKPFCYDVGYLIFDTDERTILTKKSRVIEQVWHNIPLFNTAYYADKRPLYVSALRGRTTKLSKWGYVCNEMRRDIAYYNVQCGFAYNSDFDERVFAYNCEWYHNINPIEILPIYDIRGYFHKAIENSKDFENFCEENELFTDSGAYSTTAETAYKYITNDLDFKEAHTALNDSEIELEILRDCVYFHNLEWGGAYEAKKSIERNKIRTIELYKNKELIFQDTYKKMISKKSQNDLKIYLREED